MKYRTMLWLLSSIACGLAIFAGCSYELPQVNPTAGAGGTSSSGNGGASSSGQGGSAGQAGSGGQGGSNACDPGAEIVCAPYDGPQGTDGFGTCKAETNTCSMSGTWTGCLPQVIPVPETCATKSDTNCDKLNPCLGAPIYSYPFADGQTLQDELILAVATANGNKGKDGAVYAAGVRAGMFNPQTSNYLRVLLWNRDADGLLHDWSSKFDFTGPVAPSNMAGASGVAVIPTSGDVIVTGVFFGGTLTIEGAGPVFASKTSTFFARLTSAGAVVKSRVFTGGDGLETTAMAADAAGNVYIGGSYVGTQMLDQVLLPYTLAPKAFVACLSPDGGYRWHQVFAGSGSQTVAAIASIDNTDIVVATTFTGGMNVNMANGTTNPYQANEETDILVSRLRSDKGAAVWNRQIFGTLAESNLQVGGLAANSKTIALGGRFYRNVGIGGTTYGNDDMVGTSDSFVATLSTSGGDILQHFASQGSGDQDVRGLAFDSLGDIVIAGSYSVSFRTRTDGLTTSAGIDAFVVKTDVNLNERWSQKLGDGAVQFAQGVVVGKSTGHIFVGGGFQGSLEGIKPLVGSKGGLDAFLVELAD